MPIETILPLLSNYFSNPAGLIGLAALIPLAIFYLIKREPDEQMMPSFMFFHDEEEMSSTQNAFRKLMMNLILLLHIIAIFGFAAAFANPYLGGAGTPAHSVLVLDNSGSMGGDLQEAKNFLKDNLGEKNTIITVDDSARLVAEEVPADQAASIIDNTEIRETGTNIASGLETAQRFDGKVFVASDLDQTVDEKDIADIFRDFRSNGKSYEILDLSRRNSWGFIGIEVDRDNTTLEIKNFENRENTITLTKGSKTREITIEGDTVKEVAVRSSKGKNTVKLSEDGFRKDNTAYFYIPDTGSFDVTFIADSENPFLMKAFELIDFTNITYRRPPIKGELNSDVYIIGQTDRLISGTVNSIEDDTRSGAALVLFGHQNFEEIGFENLPVRDSGGYKNTTVEIAEPVRVSLGETEIRKVQKTRGERLSANSNALIRSDYGSGEFLLYNIRDRVFNQEFMYPVFWKEIANTMTGRTPIEKLNYRTGESINEEKIVTPSRRELSGRVELDHQGFYQTSRGTVAVNMLNEDESLRDGIEVEASNTAEKGSKASAQHLIIALVLLIVLFEMGYLYRIGDIR